jgi:ribosomal protein S18 acetylase RimI-like enzyme
MTIGTLYIRPATPDDRDLIADLAARTFRAAYGSSLSADDLKRFVTSTFSPDRTEAELNDPSSRFFLAYNDAHVIGYAMLRETPTPESVPGSKPVELARIYLEESVIGRGYGAALMGECLKEARKMGHDTIWLGVWECNDRAIRFYEKWGFTHIGSHAFEFGDAIQTDLVMARPVRQAVASTLSGGPPLPAE